MASHSSPLPVVSLNHVSLLCSSVQDSVKFYHQVLGFEPIKRPSSFNFEGAWLYNYGVSIHLLQRDSEPQVLPKSSEINPKGNHISFQCADIGIVRKRLEEMGIKYVAAVVAEGGIMVDQLFFHDPDCYMIEICDCHKIPIVPLSSALLLKPQQSCVRGNWNYKRYHSFAGYVAKDTKDDEILKDQRTV
ncbi:hypothetical protein Cni_G14980 [Canna indica]|uniref:VOC domain-containing protein n=1 Tax=Canna indica TaxID=4628 RepID=A0AAQ3KD63_9LILI|nr:hypothetical protein Cni_G14980 [Canna indica]